MAQSGILVQILSCLSFLPLRTFAKTFISFGDFEKNNTSFNFAPVRPLKHSEAKGLNAAARPLKALQGSSKSSPKTTTLVMVKVRERSPLELKETNVTKERELERESKCTLLLKTFYCSITTSCNFLLCYYI